MKTNVFLLLSGIAVCTVGCQMAPDYTRPEAPVPAAWPAGPAYEEIPAEANAPAAAELPWREFFTDERVQQVIETALENNRDLRLAALNVELARSLYNIQRNELYPSAYATAGGGASSFSSV